VFFGLWADFQRRAGPVELRARIVEGHLQLSPLLGLPMPHTKHMRELGRFSMIPSACAPSIMASTRGLDKRLWSKFEPVGGEVEKRRISATRT
jgi:hypothetical protein